MNQNDKHSIGVALIGHGTRDPQDSQILFEYANSLQGLCKLPVAACFREFISPGLEEVVQEFVDNNIHIIIAVPFFLFNSSHVRKDLVEDVRLAKQKYPSCTFHIGEPIGFDSLLVDVLNKRVKKVVANSLQGESKVNGYSALL